jgi:hypothetical protein
MNLVPDDVIRDVLFPLCCASAKDAVALMLVCKQFAKLVGESNTLWKTLFVSYFQPINPDALHVKSWFKFFVRRTQASKRIDVSRSERTIENCSLVFECPLRWDELSGSVEFVLEGGAARMRRLPPSGLQSGLFWNA